MATTEVLRIAEGIELDDLKNLIAEFVGLKGCPACGLNGFDLSFEVDPRIKYLGLREKFSHVLLDVNVFEGRIGDLVHETPVRRLG